jgi:tetratricopeptide (TPR) repeat protein
MVFKAATGKSAKGVAFARGQLFDGTSLQTVAMGEEYLKGLLEKDPQNAFLCARLGNLFRGADQIEMSVPWYEKALALNPGDLEARFHLRHYAVKQEHFAEALAHSRLILEHFLQGHRAAKEDLTEYIVYGTVEDLRKWRDQFSPLAAPPGAAPAEGRVDRFIPCLLAAQGTDQDIINAATDSLIAGKVEPFCDASQNSSPQNNRFDDFETDLSLADFHPSLRAVVKAEGLDDVNLSVAIQTKENYRITTPDRSLIMISDGEKGAPWRVASLRELFRGNRQPPANLDHEPPPYPDYFELLEFHALMVCNLEGDRTDQEFVEVYSLLRRRPDGKSIGPVHDALWQVSALLLSTFVISQAEFEAICGQLARVARRSQEGVISRHYAAWLHESFKEPPIVPE